MVDVLVVVNYVDPIGKSVRTRSLVSPDKTQMLVRMRAGERAYNDGKPLKLMLPSLLWKQGGGHVNGVGYGNNA